MRAYRLISSLSGLAGAGTLLFAPWLVAEEGMWTFDNPPVKQLQDKYHFTPTRAVARPRSPFLRAPE